MTTKRKVFYSFHYEQDSWRASQVRNIGVIEGNEPVTDNDWETLTKGGEGAIKQWIKEQMKDRTCTVVLVGKDTARRKWIEYEIVESWEAGMGIVGICIHGLKNENGEIASQGANPFDYFVYGKNKKLSSIVQCYNPEGSDSTEKYDWICQNISAIVEKAINIRKTN